MLVAIGAALADTSLAPGSEPGGVEPFCLPLVHAHLSKQGSGGPAEFCERTLLIDRVGVTLCSRDSAEEMLLPLASIFDINPVFNSALEARDADFLGGPTANLVQIVAMDPGSNNGQLRVTLALPTLADTACAVRTLSAYQDVLREEVASSVDEGRRSLKVLHPGRMGPHPGPHAHFLEEPEMPEEALSPPSATAGPSCGALQLASGAEAMFPLTGKMASALATFRIEDARQPEPLTLEGVWFLVSPTCSRFHRCRLCADKLGLTLRPVAAEAAVGGAEGEEEAPSMTDLLHFPGSSILDITEDQGFENACYLEKQGLANALARALPFARALFQRTPPASPPCRPFPHVLRLRVKAALAGRLQGGPQEEFPKLRQTSPIPPPISIWLSFPERAQAVALASKMTAYRKYHIAISLSAYLSMVSVVSKREEDRGVLEEHVSPLEPPPPPPRPHDLPPASGLPRMITNDEGEVFWFMPRRPPQAAPPKEVGACQVPATTAPKPALGMEGEKRVKLPMTMPKLCPSTQHRHHVYL